MKRLLLASFLAATALTSAHAGEASLRSITVTGEASVNARPDMAVITAGVVAQADTAKGALDANSTATRSVIAAFKGEKIEAKDIETSGFSLQPLYVYPQQQDGQQQPPHITGYSVSNNVAVKVHDLESLGEIMDKVVGAGANSIGGIEFLVSKQSEILDDARGEAIKEARRKAELYAKAAGAKVGKVLVISESLNAGPPIGVPMMKAARALDSGAPVEPGEQRLDAQVSVTYELAD